MTGKAIHPFTAVVTTGDHPKYDGPRDHTRMIQHVKSRLISWLANCDTQVIIDQDLLALQKYIAGYACKGAASTEDLIHIYRTLIESTNDQSTVRNLAQRLLLKTVGMVDISAAAADFMNCGGKLQRCTRNFNIVGLSGYRQLKGSVNDDGNTITKDTPLDKFLSQKRRDHDPTINLWDYSKQCNCKCGIDHVPLFTGITLKPTWPVSEDVSRAYLMIFSHGTWNSVEDLKCHHETYAEALGEFLMKDNCPSVLLQIMKEAQNKYNKKMRKRNPSNGEILDYGSQSTQCSSQSSQLNEAEHVGRALMRDIAQQNALNLCEPHVEEALFVGGPEFDWHTYALRIMGNIWPNNAADWLRSIADEAEKREMLKANELHLPSINLLLANTLQRVVISINIHRLLDIAKGNLHALTKPSHLLIQGTAGTGKTFIISAVTGVARRLFGRHGSVMNLAPTRAASVLLPNGRTVHSTTPPARKRKDKDLATAQLSDYPMSADSLRKLRHCTGTCETGLKLMCLNLDERSMWSKTM